MGSRIRSWVNRFEAIWDFEDMVELRISGRKILSDTQSTSLQP